MVPTCTPCRLGKLSAFAVSVSVLLFFAPTTARSQSTTDAPNIEERLSKLEAGQQRIQKSLRRLETKLDRLTANASAFSRVVVRIQTSDGKPVSGYEAIMRTAPANVPTARATGTSDEEGVAIERFMPYGEYNLSLEGPLGWSVYMSDLMVEVGQPLELDVIAPDPSNRGGLILQTDLRTESFSDLPFGEIRQPTGGRGYLVESTPEPESAADRAKSFPRLEKGIGRVAVSLAIQASQRIAQPNGDDLQWRWRFTSASGTQSEKLLLTPDGVMIARGFDSKSVRPAEEGEFYTDLDEDKRVGYLTIAELEEAGDSYRIEVPAGEVEIEVDGVLGEATPAVKPSLGIDPQEVSTVWLSVNLRGDSKWIDQLFKQAGWQRTERYSRVLTKSLQVERGEKQTVTLASP